MPEDELRDGLRRLLLGQPLDRRPEPGAGPRQRVDVEDLEWLTLARHREVPLGRGAREAHQRRGEAPRLPRLDQRRGRCGRRHGAEPPTATAASPRPCPSHAATLPPPMPLVSDRISQLSRSPTRLMMNWPSIIIPNEAGSTPPAGHPRLAHRRDRRRRHRRPNPPPRPPPPNPPPPPPTTAAKPPPKPPPPRPPPPNPPPPNWPVAPEASKPGGSTTRNEPGRSVRYRQVHPVAAGPLGRNLEDPGADAVEEADGGSLVGSRLASE